MKIEDTLKGGYAGLFGEVVSEDVYRIKELKFAPNIIFDIGSNISIFTRYIRSLFPNALIIAVEPNEENMECAKYFTQNDDKIIFINKAIGIGQIYHGLTAANGSGETYLSEGLSYPKDKMEDAAKNNLGIEKSNIQTVMPDELYNSNVKDGDKVLIKIDIEGAEHTIWTHEPTMEALRKADYLCMEIHEYAFNGALLEEEKKETARALKSFEDTHTCERDGVHFFATLKK